MRRPVICPWYSGLIWGGKIAEKLMVACSIYHGRLNFGLSGCNERLRCLAEDDDSEDERLYDALACKQATNELVA